MRHLHALRESGASLVVAKTTVKRTSRGRLAFASSPMRSFAWNSSC